jgi:hypothetical protein
VQRGHDSKIPTTNGSRPVSGGTSLHHEKENIVSKKKKNTAGASGDGTDPPVTDAADIESLWLDPSLGDGIVNVTYHVVPVGKPKFYFRVVQDPAYRRRTEIVVIKQDGVIDEQNYIVAPTMRGQIAEAHPCTIVTIVDRLGSPSLWPIRFPREGERDNDAWISARAAAKVAMDRWQKLFGSRKAIRYARPSRDTPPTRIFPNCRASMSW